MKKDKVWKLVKYNGDGAYYARCSCGFQYCCSRTLNWEEEQKHHLLSVPYKFYGYCPFCGAKKETYIGIYRIPKEETDFPFEDDKYFEKAYSIEEDFLKNDWKNWFVEENI